MKKLVWMAAAACVAGSLAAAVEAPAKRSFGRLSDGTETALSIEGFAEKAAELVK